MMDRQLLRMLSRFLDTAVEQAGELAYSLGNNAEIKGKLREAEQHVRMAKRILAECLEAELDKILFPGN